MSTNDWLAQLKEGDTVLVSGGFHGLRKATVRRLTPTQVHADGYTYRRSDGEGRGLAGGRLFEPTAERLTEIEERKRLVALRVKFDSTNWNRLPLSVLEQVNAVLESHSNAEKEG